ncbi:MULTISPECIES: YsgD/CorL family protein [Kosakonia]
MDTPSRYWLNLLFHRNNS